MDGKTFQIIRICSLKVSITKLVRLLENRISSHEILKWENSNLTIPEDIVSRILEIEKHLNNARRTLRREIVNGFKKEAEQSRFLILYLSNQDFQQFGDKPQLFYGDCDLYHQVLFGARLELTIENYPSVEILPLYPEEYLKWLGSNNKEQTIPAQKEWAGAYWANKIVPYSLYAYKPVCLLYTEEKDPDYSVIMQAIEGTSMYDEAEKNDCLSYETKKNDCLSYMEIVKKHRLDQKRIITEKFGVSFDQPFDNHVLFCAFLEYSVNAFQKPE